jgi:hypothetical protein
MIAGFRVTVAAACLAVMGLLAPLASQAQTAPPDWDKNLVYNGDFSANGGSLDGWTYNEGGGNYYWSLATASGVYYASNGSYGAASITGTEAEQDYLYQTIPTIPKVFYKLTFTYDGGAGGVNELKVLFGKQVVEDIVNVGAGSNTYSVIVRAHRFDTKLNFLGRQDNAFASLTGISVTLAPPTAPPIPPIQ